MRIPPWKIARTTLVSPDSIAELLEASVPEILLTSATRVNFINTKKAHAAMGPLVSAVIGNLYMEFFERIAFNSVTSILREDMWLDDTFCIIKKGTEEELLEHPNRIRPTIKFTMKLE